MIRLVLALFLLTALVSAAALLANLPGQVAFYLAGYTLETSLAGLMGAVAALIVLLAAVGWLVHLLWHIPTRLRAARAAQNRESGEAALADALMALARGDAGMASQASLLARQKLPDRALPLLMSAQAALLDNKPEAAQEDYRAMLGAAATPAQRQLGLQGLYYLAQRQGDVEAAGTYALQVLETAPKTLWALDGLMALAVRIGDWSAAHDWLRRWSRAGVKRAAVRRRRAILFLAEAQKLTASSAPGDQSAALDKALAAAKLEPSFLPAIALAARLLAAHGQLAKARRLLRQAWTKTPHRALADAWLACTSEQPASSLMRAAAPLVSKQKSHAESHILRARIALKTQRFSLARTLLEPLVEAETEAEAGGQANGREAPRHVLGYLAEAASGEGDEAQAAHWRDRARQAPPEAGWMAAGLRLGEWQAICPVTGRLDAVVWQQPQATQAALATLATQATQATATSLADANGYQHDGAAQKGAPAARLGGFL